MKLARTEREEGDYRQGQCYKVTKDDETKELKAQIACVTQAGKIDTEPTAETPMDMFAALHSTLETIEANKVNGPAS